VQEKFAVAFGAVDRRVDDFDGCAADFGDAGADAVNGELVRGGVADDASLADVLAAGFKLRLDEDDGFERLQSHGGDDRRQDERGGDERHIHGEESDSRRQIAGDQVAGVGALHKRDARVAAEAFGDLAIAGIDGEHAGGSVLQHAVGEAAGGGSYVEAETAGEVDLPVTQCGFELESAAADIAEIVAEHAKCGGVRNGVAGLFDLLFIDEDTSSDDERLGALTRTGESALDEQPVQTCLHPTAASFIKCEEITTFRSTGSIGIIEYRVDSNSMAQDPHNPVSPPNPDAGDPRSSHRATASLNEADDMGLLTRLQTGDQEAMASLFDRYGTIVYSVALRVLKDKGEAEDVMQEIFVQVWKNPGGFISGRGSLGGWLTVVARNRSIDVLRRRKPSDPVELFALPSATNLARESERNVLLEKVRGAMVSLPDEQKKSLELAYFEGLTHSEIAEKTGDPLGTVKTRIRLALITIRKALKV
jgi:RNA polymerase sigma-70 factor, ECF subfamily